MGKKNHLIACHPHGMLCFGAVTAFGSDSCELSRVFPGILTRITTLQGTFLLPIFREFLLQAGAMAASRSSLETIYTSHCIVSEGRSKVETVGTGEWFYNSSKGLQRPEGSGGSLRPARASGTNKSKGEGLGVVAKRVGQKVCEGPEVNKHAQTISKPVNVSKGTHTEAVNVDKERTSQELSEEEALKVIAEKEIQPMSMMMTKEGLETANTKTVVKKTASPVKKTTVQVEKSSDVKKSQTETEKLTAVKKVVAKRTLNKEKKKQLPAWMEKIEKQLGLMSLPTLEMLAITLFLV